MNALNQMISPSLEARGFPHFILERELITESSIVPETIINPDPEAPALPHIAFADAVAESEANLTVLDQCIILALWHDFVYIRNLFFLF